MSDKNSPGKLSTAIKVAIIGAIATMGAALIPVVAPSMFTSGKKGQDGQVTPSLSPTEPQSSPTPDETRQDINLSAESVLKTIGVLGPPTNPMTEYQALTSAWRRTGDGRVEPVPPLPDEPRRVAQWAFQAQPGV